MPRPAALTDPEIAAALAELADWTLLDRRLHRVVELADFPAALAFMVQVGFVADQLDHHPDWSNSYRRVTIDLTTHDVGGLTRLDLELARAIDRILSA